MTQGDVTLLVAVLTGAVTVSGWFTTKYLERRQKRAEFRRTYIERQIEEFYGPIYSLIWQIFTTSELKDRILHRCQLNAEEKNRVQEYFSETYFRPLHTRIKTILETKLYLVDGTEMPDSVYTYLRHSMQEDSQHRLWKEQGVSTAAVPGEPFPKAFHDTIKDTLQKLMGEYEVNVQELKTGTAGSGELPRKKSNSHPKEEVHGEEVPERAHARHRVVDNVVRKSK